MLHHHRSNLCILDVCLLRMRGAQAWLVTYRWSTLFRFERPLVHDSEVSVADDSPIITRFLCVRLSLFGFLLILPCWPLSLSFTLYIFILLSPAVTCLHPSLSVHMSACLSICLLCFFVSTMCLLLTVALSLFSRKLSPFSQVSFIRSFIHSFIHSSIHPFDHPLINISFQLSMRPSYPSTLPRFPPTHASNIIQVCIIPPIYPFVHTFLHAFFIYISFFTLSLHPLLTHLLLSSIYSNTYISPSVHLSVPSSLPSSLPASIHRNERLVLSHESISADVPQFLNSIDLPKPSFPAPLLCPKGPPDVR